MLVEDFSFTVIEEEGQFVVVEREESETSFRAAELCALSLIHLACQRAGTVDKIFNLAVGPFDVLEIVDVPTKVHIDTILLKQRLDTLLHILALGIRFARVGEDRMMTYNQFPFSFGRSQRFLQPFKLIIDALFAGIGIFLRILPVFLDKRRCIDEEYL